MAEKRGASADPPKPPRLPAFSPRSSQALADRLRALIVARKVEVYTTFAKEAGVAFGEGTTDNYYSSRLSIWYNNPSEEYEKLGQDNYIKLATHIINKYEYIEPQIGVPILEILRQPMYHAISPVLRSDADKSVRQHMEGAYKIYKASIRHIGYYYVGLLELQYDAVAHAFIFRERYEITRHNVLEATWDMRGSIFPIHKGVHMSVCVDVEDASIQTKYIDDVGYNGDNITYLSGWVTDLEAGKYYTTPFVCDPIATTKGFKFEFKDLRVMPERIREFLSRHKLVNFDDMYYTGPYAENRTSASDVRGRKT